MEKAQARSIWDRFWNDKGGKSTILQTPNIPLLVWLVSMVSVNIIKHGHIHAFFDTVGFGSLFTWAYLEIKYGDSYFRRLLGAIVIIVIVLNKV